MRRALSLIAPLLVTMSSASFAQEGRILFLNAAKGGCTNCHQVPSDPTIKSLSSIGPKLVGVKEKYPTPEALDAAIGDFEKQKPGSFMPPYRKHRLLTDAEIAAIARYVWTL